ncbi:TNFAIP3-interacting protein 3 isoform X3 [Pseudorca crassidens]|uniref:TNFAIP3-interacting protein 3 isoform X3 n=1 Tax=Pseudorca crassidens TaxID=82174 RepID=UPI00352C47E9
MSGTETSTEHAEWTQSSRRKNLTNFLEQKIRCLEKQRKEVAELKTKLDTAESFLGTLEKELQQSQRESDLQQREEKEKESLNEELHELKRENTLLKEKIALASQKKQHFECEIKRLNKALQDALKMECSSSPEDCLRKSEMECSREEMRTEMEVLKQQVQIYEEDFKKERSDRERLSQEKEELQQINQTSQTQLNRLNSQIKAGQMEKEKLERQLKQHCSPQMYFLTSNYGWNFHLRDPCLPTGPGAVQDLQKYPPDCQWYAPDLFPPDVQDKANANARATEMTARMRSSVSLSGTIRTRPQVISRNGFSSEKKANA